MKQRVLALFLAAGAFLLSSGCGSRVVVDEAMAAGKTAADYPTATVDHFKEMDGGVELTADEIKGRNTWMLWTGGNEAFWELMSRRGYGLIDFLKTIDSRKRTDRFKDMGLVNEPGFRQSETPDQYGLFIDVPESEEPKGIDPEVYGKSTGVIGLRLFPNPKFDDAARSKWDAKRYYEDPSYYQNPELVRPYRVGMSCAICHVSFHPVYPPADTSKPDWRNLTATLGNQYFRNRGVFGADLKPDNLLYHLLGSARPGTVDTSIIATDHNNNPNIINSIFNVEARLTVAVEENVSGGALKLEGGGAKRRVPHILVDGADSVGVQAALDRVFVNIGTYSEEWLRCHNPILGFRKPKPFRIENAQKNSVFWQVTERRCIDLAKYLVKASRPMYLKDAPGGEQYLTKDSKQLDRGRIVFAERCMACHSSKRPNDGVDRPPEKFEEWVHSDAFLNWARTEVMKPDFLENNFLSTDARYPVTLLKSNAGRSLQNNAITGGIWEEFSSDNYKATPSVGEIEVYDPFAKKDYKFRMPSGGPGFYKVPTLVSIWSQAPFLHNNALGDFTGDPSVAGRMKAFDDAITKMLWEQRRPGIASITRTTEKSYLHFPAVYLPVAVEGILGPVTRPFLRFPLLLPVLVLASGILVVLIAGKFSHRTIRWIGRLAGGAISIGALVLIPLMLFAAGKMGDLKVGPFPKGTPVNLLANMDPHANPLKVVPAMLKMNRIIARIEREKLSDDEAQKLFETEAAPDILKLSKSPDWIEDRGHYFASTLSDADKLALIEFLKTF